MADPGERRPSPDALLELAAKERRGKLKIFLGAAPGVGKTFAMLSAAQRLRGEDKDVVIGVVETHGRPETSALLAGLEVLPRRAIDYRGHTLMEFDLDGALARKPRLIVVDELAHTNAPESRHPKRYQDVEELLNAGIDVWTALNIQHLESLSDVVSAITGVKVRELVPDTVVENADDVVVVDLTPDELIQRLREGKVYQPENARRAADNFLKSGNLTALRELTLRRTAERVDDQMIDYLRQNAIEGPWPAAERILVCVGADQLSEEVVRTAARMASALNATWTAVHLSKPSGASLDAEGMKRVDAALALAARLGGETTRLSSNDLVDEVLRFARQENVTQILIGRAAPTFFKRLVGRSLPDEIMRQAHGIAVHVVTGDSAPRRRLALKPNFTWNGFAAAPIAVVAATLVGLATSHLMKPVDLSMVFLTAVLFCAVTFGTWSAIAAAILSFLAYNFFFIEPRYTFTVASPHELLALVVFLLVAIVTGSLAGRVREQKLAALARVRQVQTLFDLSRKLSATPKIDDIMWIVVSQAAATVKGQSIVLLKKGEELEIMAGMPPEDTLGPADWTAARWAVSRGETAGWSSETLPNAHYQFRPVRSAQGIAGCVGLRPAAGGLSAETERMIEALLDQASVALERTLLTEEAANARAAAEGEKLRSALLSSISHDLRTPLSSILGSATALRSLGNKMPRTVRADLLATIEEEATRLSHFVANLLDMTKLEGGAVRIASERVDVPDVVAAAVRRARNTWPERDVKARTEGTIPAITGDASLLEQLMLNLLDNAHRYSPAGTPTAIRIAREGEDVVISVEDEGPGIPPADLERIFAKFYRIKEGDGRPPGTGLGLAICRAIATAMGGTIIAESPVAEAHGTRIVVRLPARSET